MVSIKATVLLMLIITVNSGAVRIPESVQNLLLEAKVSGNLESFEKGLRGAVDHMIYDNQTGRFVKESQWHEYGVGFEEDLGIVAEDDGAWWIAQWKKPIKANLIVLSGTYNNQPQPNTAWKIELRREGRWRVHARGVGGWYDRGLYAWGGPLTKTITFDALRVSTFSKDKQTPIGSIHYRGQKGLSWVVAYCPPIDARIAPTSGPIHAGEAATFETNQVMGKITSWKWYFGDGTTGNGSKVSHAFVRPGTYDVRVVFSDGKDRGWLTRTVVVDPPVEARIRPLDSAVKVGRVVKFVAKDSVGKIVDYAWDFGDGGAGAGRSVRHTFIKAGIYKVILKVSDGTYFDECLALVRVHTDETLGIPQVLLDTDQKNEQDDQHYLGYALFSNLNILGVNSVHHGGGQEPMNYAEILNIIELAMQSGLAKDRKPLVFRGANERLEVPAGGIWSDTTPIRSAASEAILAAARGAAPENPVWVVPVGPGTNVASAILQARAEGLELDERIRIMWLGGSNDGITNEFNGNNDPWSMYVVCQSGIETWIMPAPVGARVRIDKRTEADYYADNPLGQYLLKIVPARNKPLFDPSCLSAIISMRLKLGWVKQTEPVVVNGSEKGYRWLKTEGDTSVWVIRQIDQQAMKEDIFRTMKGIKKRL
ncbi:MAG: PKD domain-containing protein [Planctomycetota bacterium]|jgi:PKD repeat protein